MCLSKAYLTTLGERKLLMSEITLVKIDKDKVTLQSLFGEQKDILASVKEVNFVTNSILIEQPNKTV